MKRKILLRQECASAGGRDRAEVQARKRARDLQNLCQGEGLLRERFPLHLGGNVTFDHHLPAVYLDFTADPRIAGFFFPHIDCLSLEPRRNYLAFLKVCSNCVGGSELFDDDAKTFENSVLFGSHPDADSRYRGTST